MSADSVLGMTALSLNIIVLRTMVEKGLLTQGELKEEIDAAMLLMEEQGLVFGEEGRAVHTNLAGVLQIVSAPRPTKAP